MNDALKLIFGMKMRSDSVDADVTSLLIFIPAKTSLASTCVYLSTLQIVEKLRKNQSVKILKFYIFLNLALFYLYSNSALVFTGSLIDIFSEK